MRGSFAVSPADVWAVGDYAPGQGVVASSQHWDGTRWLQLITPHPSQQSALYGVVALAANDAWAVGQFTPPAQNSYPLIMHSNGVCP
jgi:hypothetical protein